MASRFQQIQQILKAKNINAREFADRIGSSQGSISNVIRDRNKPSLGMLQGIARTFPDINLRWLITGEGSMYDSPTNLALPEQEPTFRFNNDEIVEKRPVKNQMKGEIPDTSSSPPPPFVPQDSPIPAKKVRRVILFFDDGSFEDYGD
jgi:transcriptional regulator with XRE-family HTH domain